MPVTDLLTGEIRQTAIFVAILGASNYTCCDVTYWYLKMELDGHKIVVQGSDAYPASSGPNVSKEFREFFRAVKNLVGLEP